MEGWKSTIHFYQDTTMGKQCKGAYIYSYTNYPTFNVTALSSTFIGISSNSFYTNFNVTRLEAYKVTFY